MKKISWNYIIKYYEKNNDGKEKFYYKTKDGEHILMKPVFDANNNICDFYDEDDKYLMEEMALWELMELEFYVEVED